MDLLLLALEGLGSEGNGGASWKGNDKTPAVGMGIETGCKLAEIEAAAALAKQWPA